MLMTVNEAADALGVSAQRVHALIDNNRLVARKTGYQWMVESDGLLTARKASRSMTTRNAWLLFELADKGTLSGVRAEEVYRLRKRLDRLRDNVDDADFLLRSWTANRAERACLEVSDTKALAKDERVVLSGISDTRSGIISQGEVEGYVARANLDSLVRDHAMFRSSDRTGNVVLHMVDDASYIESGVSLLAIAADLSEYGSDRESAAAIDLVREALA